MEIEAGKRYNRRDGEISEEVYWRQASYSVDHVYWADGNSYDSHGSYISGEQNDFDLISEYIEPTAEPQPEYGPWIGHNGGECPVGSDELGQTIFKGANGEVHQSPCTSLYSQVWGYVIAYRVKIEPKTYTNKVWVDITDGQVFDSQMYTKKYRPAIITLTGDLRSRSIKIDIAWADE